MSDVEFHGPLFDGIADRLLKVMEDDIERSLAQDAAQMVRSNLGQVLQHPTGYYESNIDAQPSGGDWEVNDGGVVYGPWLEGVGSRNRTTRFKGYATFRRTAQQFEARAGDLAEPIVFRYVSRMN